LDFAISSSYNKHRKKTERKQRDRENKETKKTERQRNLRKQGNLRIHKKHIDISDRRISPWQRH
jgi:hypothetical protein